MANLHQNALMRKGNPMEMKNLQIETVNRYFQNQNRGDLKGVVDLFDPDGHEIQNVHLPLLSGPDASRKLCEGLYGRTKERAFKPLRIGYSGDGRTVMVEWEAELTFRQGAVVGDLRVPRDLQTKMRGVNIFTFPRNSAKISRLDIYHETSSVPILIRKMQDA